jgi:hypothetical protein
MLVQDIEVQLVGPPVSVRRASTLSVFVIYARYRVFFFIHDNAPFFV